jgi:hypothetical protein
MLRTKDEPYEQFFFLQFNSSNEAEWKPWKLRPARGGGVVRHAGRPSNLLSLVVTLRIEAKAG